MHEAWEEIKRSPPWAKAAFAFGLLFIVSGLIGILG